MDHTKCKTFIAFRHVEDKDTFWIDDGWVYSTECPALFPYQTKEEKERVHDVFNSYITSWKLKQVEAVIFKNSGIESIKIDKILEETVPKKRKKNATATDD